MTEGQHLVPYANGLQIQEVFLPRFQAWQALFIPTTLQRKASFFKDCLLARSLYGGATVPAGARPQPTSTLCHIPFSWVHPSVGLHRESFFHNFEVAEPCSHLTVQSSTLLYERGILYSVEPKTPQNKLNIFCFLPVQEAAVGKDPNLNTVESDADRFYLRAAARSAVPPDGFDRVEFLLRRVMSDVWYLVPISATHWYRNLHCITPWMINIRKIQYAREPRRHAFQRARSQQLPTRSFQ